jgi:hypothetical protein
VTSAAAASREEVGDSVEVEVELPETREEREDVDELEALAVMVSDGIEATEARAQSLFATEGKGSQVGRRKERKKRKTHQRS